ncbi:glycosyltransferase [Thermococcus sp.]
MFPEILLALILLWDGYFFLRYLLSLRKAYRTREWKPRVSVLIPAYNEGENIEDAVKAALSQDYPDLEVIVIDDGSEDGTYERASSVKDERLKVIKAEHGGKARALNIGLKVASGEIVVTTDADGFLEEKAVSELVRRFYSGEIVAVGGQVRVAGRRFLELAQDVEHLRIAMFRRAKELENLSLAPGPVSAFRREILLEVGGFVEDPVEDYATTIALKRIGRVLYAPTARAWVRMPLTLSSLWRQRKRWFLGDLSKLGAGPLKDRFFLAVGDAVAFSDVAFPLVAIALAKWALLGLFIGFEMLTMAAAVREEGGSSKEVILFPVLLWFWAAFYLCLHVYGYIWLVLSKKGKRWG